MSRAATGTGQRNSDTEKDNAERYKDIKKYNHTDHDRADCK